MAEMFSGAKWIWESEDISSVNQHVIFEKRFTSESLAGRIALSCDTDFRLSLNGTLVGKDQFPDYPDAKTYTSYELSGLRRGENVIRIAVYYAGKNTSTYVRGPAGLIAVLELADGQRIVTDRSWQVSRDPAFDSGPIAQVSTQLGYVIGYDGALSGHTSFHDSLEREDAVGGSVRSLTERRLPPLVDMGPVAAKVVSDRLIERKVVEGSFADMVAGDVIVSDPNACTGRVLVGDLGRECVGEFYVDLIAPAGAVIDISHGECLLETGLVHNKIHDRNFTDRYRCKAGRNRYVMPFRRLGARYLQLTITGVWEDVEVLEFGLREMSQRLPELSFFETDLAYSSTLYAVAARTLRCCMHNHYEDCPWREQSLYGYDSRMQMLFNYYSYGNVEFARESLDLLGRGLNRENGYLNLCAPTCYGITIPCFSMVWVCALYEHYLYSGDRSLLEAYDGQLRFMADSYLAHGVPGTGVYRPKADRSLWDFYEWVDGLSGSYGGCVQEGADAVLCVSLFNVYLYEMLQALVLIHRVLGKPEWALHYERIARALGSAVEALFWDDERGCYGTVVRDGSFVGPYHVHTQAVMLKNGLVPKEKACRVLSAMDKGWMVAMSFSPLVYLLEGMFATDAEHRRRFVDKINGMYLKMTDEGATTFYETQDGHAAFDHAGSLCHAWSSIHSYYYGSKVLGIRPLTAGFKSFELKIYGMEFGRVSGEVPTPSGKITVAWERTNGKLAVTVRKPKALAMVTDSYPECPLDTLNVEDY